MRSRLQRCLRPPRCGEVDVPLNPQSDMVERKRVGSGCWAITRVECEFKGVLAGQSAVGLLEPGAHRL